MAVWGKIRRFSARGPWQALRFRTEWRGRGALDFQQGQVLRGPQGPHPHPAGAPWAPNPGRPAHRAVAFETRRGIPALDREGVGATGKQIGPSRHALRGPPRQRPCRGVGPLAEAERSPVRGAPQVSAGSAGAGYGGGAALPGVFLPAEAERRWRGRQGGGEGPS